MPRHHPHDLRSALIAILIFILITSLGGCFFFGHKKQDGPPKIHVDISQIKDPVPHYLPKSRYGNPRSYVVDGKRYYVLRSDKNYHARGIASWYGTKFHGKLTSTREPYNMFAMTAASPVLPIPCFVRVTNLENGRQVIVKVNDRGPFAPNRIIDLSYAAAMKLGYEKRGTAMVEVSSIDFHHPYAARPVTISKRPQLYLQVAAYRNQQSAINLKRRLKKYTMHRIRIARSRNYPRVYRVQIGPLRGVDESDLLQQQLEKAGLGHPVTVIG